MSGTAQHDRPAPGLPNRYYFSGADAVYLRDLERRATISSQNKVAPIKDGAYYADIMQPVYKARCEQAELELRVRQLEKEKLIKREQTRLRVATLRAHRKFADDPTALAKELERIARPARRQPYGSRLKAFGDDVRYTDLSEDARRAYARAGEEATRRAQGCKKNGKPDLKNMTRRERNAYNEAKRRPKLTRSAVVVGPT